MQRIKWRVVRHNIHIVPASEEMNRLSQRYNSSQRGMSVVLPILGHLVCPGREDEATCAGGTDVGTPWTPRPTKGTGKQHRFLGDASRSGSRVLAPLGPVRKILSTGPQGLPSGTYAPRTYLYGTQPHFPLLAPVSTLP